MEVRKDCRHYRSRSLPTGDQIQSADWEVTKKPHLDAPNSAFSLKREIFPMQVGIVNR